MSDIHYSGKHLALTVTGSNRQQKLDWDSTASETKQNTFYVSFNFFLKLRNEGCEQNDQKKKSRNGKFP